MSKRITKKKLVFPQYAPYQTRKTFDELNAEMHNITVSTPVLFFINRLVSDPKFRTKVTKLLS